MVNKADQSDSMIIPVEMRLVGKMSEKDLNFFSSEDLGNKHGVDREWKTESAYVIFKFRRYEISRNQTEIFRFFWEEITYNSTIGTDGDQGGPYFDVHECWNESI